MKILNLLNEIYSDKIVNFLITKFKKESPRLRENIIRGYIERFYEIKNSPKIEQKDITKYSWKQLERIVDMNQSKKLQTKSNDIRVSNSDLIYNENNLKIYLANSKESCIKYGSGYSFCISARSGDNMYSSYRIDNGWTIYFVIDDDKTKEKDNDGTFIDPYHLLVIMVKDDGSGWSSPYYIYELSTADNDGERELGWVKIAKLQPKLKNLQKLFVPVKIKEIEKKLHVLKIEYDQELNKITYNNYNNKGSWNNTYLATNIENYKYVNGILTGEIKPKIYSGFDNYNQQIVRQLRLDNIDIEKWVDEFSNFGVENGYINNITIDKHYLQYLREVRNLMLKYLNEKNRLKLEYKK